MTSGVAISHWPGNHAACVHRDRSYRTAAPESERLTAAPSRRAFVRTFKYQRRSRRAYNEHRSHSLARRAPSGVRDDKPASWNARPALTRSQRPALGPRLHTGELKIAAALSDAGTLADLQRTHGRPWRLGVGCDYRVVVGDVAAGNEHRAIGDLLRAVAAPVFILHRGIASAVSAVQSRKSSASIDRV
jgi:hypothetical protein